MYLDCSVADLIKRLRLKNGMSQEVLAEGICAPESISRIENENQVPSHSTFRNIMERLGEPGFFSWYYLYRDNLILLDVETRLLESFELMDYSGFESALDLFNSWMTKRDIHQKQFFMFGEYLANCFYSRESKGSIDFLLSLMKYTYSDYDIDKDIETYLYGHTELLILNNIALLYIAEAKYKKAKRIYKKLISNYSKSRRFLPYGRKIKAGLYNNLAFCLYKIGEVSEASMLIKRAKELLFFEGGVYFRLCILKTAYLIRAFSVEGIDLSGDYVFIKMEYEKLQNMKRINLGFDEFMEMSPYLMVF